MILTTQVTAKIIDLKFKGRVNRNGGHVYVKAFFNSMI